MLCINMDITMLQNVNTMLMNYLKTDLEAGRNPGTGEHDVPQDVMAVIDKLIMSVIGSTDTRELSRSKCVGLVRLMDEKGIFLVKGAMDKVAELMGVSRVTIYSYLDEARGKKGIIFIAYIKIRAAVTLVVTAALKIALHIEEVPVARLLVLCLRRIIHS